MNTFLASSMKRGFSLVEVLAAIAIIGVVTFLAIPNLVRIKEDGERNLAVSRAEALNMAIVSYIQHNGLANASSEWTGKSSDQRYALVAPYLAFAPDALSDYMPADYGATFPDGLSAQNLGKVGLRRISSEAAIDY